MDLETEGINFDIWEPGAKLGSVVDSSANQPRLITNNTPIAHGGGPTREKLPVQGPNIDPI